MRTWRFVTLMLTALAMSIAFCHLLALPAKLAYQGPVWLLLQQTLYGNHRVLGVVIELAALACAFILILLVRGRRPALGWTVFAAACLLGAQAVWWAGVVPVNAEVAALGALVLSVIGETPRRV